MDVIKQIVIILLFIPFLTYGQKNMHSKDTIYILYNKNKHSKKIINHPKTGKSLYFKKIDVYYDYKKKLDTLCVKHLRDYNTLTLDEINHKEQEYYKKRFKNRVIIRNKNWVFKTYLIEVISKEFFIIYPVIWAGEGIID